jgi:4-alpha-glucanotransferase
MTISRSSGVLLHPTSFPGRFGIGSLGDEALEWLDWLERAGQKLWQILPLGHTGYGDSPYQSFGAFAGNPLLISLERMAEQGWLSAADLENPPAFPADLVDYGWIYVWKWPVIQQAHANFRAYGTNAQREAFQAFRTENASWLEDYALFMACKDANGGTPWTTWPNELVHRDPHALETVRRELEDSVSMYAFAQWVFFDQWASVRASAQQKGIRIIGDIPIFVAHDSSDVWANQHLFDLMSEGAPRVVAGVPPDYFSATGQLWGNPHYRWDVMQQDGFGWWLQRFFETFKTVDIVRVDHFRGFDAFWEVPWPAETAMKGQWVKAPGVALFDAVRARFGELAIIAEDLGVITPEVEALRDGFGLPGMKILQFAFYDGPDDPFLPHTYKENCVVYTGTHDNDTTRGWWDSEPEDVQKKVLNYLKLADDADIVWDLIRAGWRSRAVMSLAPLQDLLDLPTDARMNLPGSLGGRNWGWRYASEVLSDGLADQLRALTLETNR